VRGQEDDDGAKDSRIYEYKGIKEIVERNVAVCQVPFCA